MKKHEMMKTRRVQGGFTLIELMIVVAIVGILAAIAIPRYQDYVARSQVSEGLSLASGMKVDVSEYFLTNGTWPNSGSYAVGTAGNASDAAGKFVQTLTNGASGAIQITMKASDVSNTISGMAFSLTPTLASGGEAIAGWVCSASDSTKSAYLPSSCK